MSRRFSFQRFELEVDLVGHPAAALDVVAPLPLEAVGEKAPPLRQGMVSAVATSVRVSPA